MMSRLIKLVEAFPKRRVLLAGDLILDRYVYGDAERISPEAPVPVLRAVDREERVGGAGNVAACLSELGIDVLCCGTIGTDQAGRQLLDLLTETGANVEGVLPIADRPTTTKTRFIGLAQHRHRQQLLRFDEEDASPVDLDILKKLTAFVRSCVKEVDVVCLEDYRKGLFADAFISDVITAARQAGKRVIVDPAYMPDYGMYRHASAITPNRAEFALVAGQAAKDLGQIKRQADKLRSQLSLEALIVTLDRDGAILSRRDGDAVHIATRPRAVYDNTGAGDAVLSMLAAALAAGAEFDDAVRLANIGGGLEVEKFGCVPIRREEVIAELRIEHRRTSGKLRHPDELVSELQLRRDRGQTVVFTNGCFDILHRGHVDYLNDCRRRGDILVVGLNSDGSVRGQSKGADRPINKQHDRAAVLAALECVDYVTIFEEPDPEQLIRKIHPDVLIKGRDWADKWVCGKEFVESYGGRVELLPLTEGFSTTGLIQRIREGSKS